MSIDCEGIAEVGSIESHPEDTEWRKYWDDISGQELDAALTKAARAEEVSEIHRMGVYDKVSIEECLRETGRPPICTRWVAPSRAAACASPASRGGTGGAAWLLISTRPKYV